MTELRNYYSTRATASTEYSKLVIGIGDVVESFDKLYEEAIDKTKELHVHPCRKDSMIPILTQHRGDYYFNYIKVVFNSNIEEDRTYIIDAKRIK